MATIAEVELMNRGFDRMADTLLRKRMLEEQAKERETSRADRRSEQERQFGLEERRTVASEKSAAASEDMRKLLLEDRKTQDAIGQVRNQINDVTTRHRAGQISTEQANAQIARLKSSIEQGTNLILKESGLADFTLQDVPQKEAGEFNTAATRNLQERLKLEQAVAQAKTPEEKIMAERALELWKEERGNAGGDTERVTEYERDPETGELVRSRTRSQRPEAGGRKPEGGGQKAAGPVAGKPVPPRVGEVRNGYKFLGGDPGSPKSWQKI